MSLPIATEIYLRRMLADFGVPPGESELIYQQDSFTGNGSTRAFSLSQTPNSSATPFIYLNTVLQSNDGLQSNSYTISGTTVTFATAPGNGVAILAVYAYS